MIDRAAAAALSVLADDAFVEALRERALLSADGIGEVLDAAREAGAETEIFLVADKDIKGCDGCESCFKTGVCKIKDDMQELYQKMEAANGIIFGSRWMTTFRKEPTAKPTTKAIQG